ncbi:hypothetical protein BGX33_006503 [Mortierella sp. NVP41]|nr:hypothetical protein BGX33_006503 [Mortierella sp. NVP41]
MGKPGDTPDTATAVETPTATLATSGSGSISAAAVSVLEIPELMGHIFGWIDDDTVNRTVLLVCRQWFLWNQHRAFRDLYWNSERSRGELESKVLSRLGGEREGQGQEQNGGRGGRGPNRLFCHVRDVRVGSGDSSLDKWEDLVGALDRTAQSRYGRESRSVCSHGDTNINGGASECGAGRARKDSKKGIRHLTITGTIRFDDHMWSILPRLRTLTSLMIKLDSHGQVFMHHIFDSCPRLESLYLESTGWVSVPGTHWLVNQDVDEQQPLTTQDVLQATMLQYPLPLQSLVLRNAQFDQSALENFVLSVPFLRRIQIAAWLPYLHRPDPSHCQRLCTLLKAYCPLVETFHFSFHGLHFMRTSREENLLLEPVMESWPRMTDWMLCADHLWRDLIERLPLDVLTTLELIGEDCRALHGYLCTATHLQHLKAPRTHFPYKHMDIHLRLTEGFPSTGLSGSSPAVGSMSKADIRVVKDSITKVWACRGLLTLHLAFPQIGNNPEASRTIFGYISRVCPRLRDLEICGPEGLRNRKVRPTPMCLTLEGGFCLLARLKDLERLFVGIVRLDLGLVRRDLGWMMMTVKEKEANASPVLGSTTRKKKKAMVGRPEWGSLLRKEQVRESLRIQNIQNWLTGDQVDGDISLYSGDGQDSELHKSLEHLGLLKDVVMMLEEDMTEREPGDTQGCWIDLRRMSIYTGNRLGESLESEYERLLVSKQSPGLFAGIRSFVEHLVSS